MKKRMFFLLSVLFSALSATWAQTETTYSPTLDVNFRTASGNTAWNSGYPKSAADDGNTDFELTYTAGLFALQKYTVPDLQYATKLVLTLTVGSKSGVDAVRVWSFANTTWTASSGVDDIVNAVTATVGIAPRATEGTANTPLVTGSKVAESDPAKATFTITGTVLATIKANAAADGTFTLLLTNNDLTNSNNKRSYLSSNTANAEANRPTLVATTTPPTAKIGNTEYATLAEAWAAAVAADADATIEVSGDQKLTGRLTWNKAHTLNIVPTKDITITGHQNQMWFLTNANDGTLHIGSDSYTVTLDGENKTFGAYGVTCYENSSVISLQNVTFKNFDLNNAGWLVNSKANEGQIILENVTFNNCKNPASAFINKLRVTNDRLVLKGYLNQTDCTGITIYAAAETKDSGTTGRIKVDGSDFSANSDITINFAGATKAENVIVVIGTTWMNAVRFRMVNADGWTLKKHDSKGDLYMTAATTYNHPALLHTASDITRVKGLLSQEPWKSAYSALETASGGTAAGAVEWLKRMDKSNWESTYPDYANFSRLVTDAKLAYYLALRYQLKSSTAAATSAVNILNDWAANCKGIFRLEGYKNNIPDPNEYLILIQAYQLANAAELLRGYDGWAAADQTNFKNWMKQTFADVAILFLSNHHQNGNAQHYWLNWDLAAMNAVMSIGILCDDAQLINFAKAYTTDGKGTGRAAEGFAYAALHNDADSDEILAQCQESGRDQGHATLNVTLLGVLCQTAQHIGEDFFTPYKALEMAEYVGKYNLKNDADAFCYDNVPFAEYTNKEVTHTAISSEARGTVRPSWELFYAYAKNNGKAARYSQMWAEQARNNNAGGETTATSTDELGFGTLMFMSGDANDYSYTLNVSDAGAATLILPFDATIPAGVEVYTLNYTTGQSVVTPTEVTGVLAANTPVLVMAKEGDYDFTGASIWQKAATKTSDALTGVYQKTIVPTDSYILTKKDGIVAFRKADGATNTVEANHAYLTATGAGAPMLSINFGGNTTGIANVKSQMEEGRGEYYNLNGQRVAHSNKGLYIVNGKKMVVK